MDNNSVVEQIVRSLSFEVEAVPQDNIIQVTTTSKTAPLNVKIRVRKKHEAGFQYGILALSKPGVPDSTPERIRLVSSEQTIMSFDMVMEADFEIPKRKPRKNILGIFKPSICMGAQSDDDNYAYLPTTSYKAEIDKKSEGAMKKLTLKRENVASAPKKNKDIFGKCKPGGCLDPPFGEDKYSYSPAKVNEQTTTPIICIPNVTERTSEYTDEKKSRSSSIISRKLFNRKRKSKDESIENNLIKKESKAESVLDLYQAGSLQTSVTYSNSIMTYPPTLNSSEFRIQEEKSYDNRINTNSSKNSFNVHSGNYFVTPKMMKNILDENFPLKLEAKSNFDDVKDSTLSTNSLPKSANNIPQNQDLEHDEKKHDLQTKDSVTDVIGGEGYFEESAGSNTQIFRSNFGAIPMPETENQQISKQTPFSGYSSHDNFGPHNYQITLLSKTEDSKNVPFDKDEEQNSKTEVFTTLISSLPINLISDIPAEIIPQTEDSKNVPLDKDEEQNSKTEVFTTPISPLPINLISDIPAEIIPQTEESKNVPLDKDEEQNSKTEVFTTPISPLPINLISDTPAEIIPQTEESKNVPFDKDEEQNSKTEVFTTPISSLPINLISDIPAEIIPQTEDSKNVPLDMDEEQNSKTEVFTTPISSLPINLISDIPAEIIPQTEDSKNVPFDKDEEQNSKTEVFTTPISPLPINLISDITAEIIPQTEDSKNVPLDKDEEQNSKTGVFTAPISSLPINLTSDIPAEIIPQTEDSKNVPFGKDEKQNSKTEVFTTPISSLPINLTSDIPAEIIPLHALQNINNEDIDKIMNLNYIDKEHLSEDIREDKNKEQQIDDDIKNVWLPQIKISNKLESSESIKTEHSVYEPDMKNKVQSAERLTYDRGSEEQNTIKSKYIPIEHIQSISDTDLNDVKSGDKSNSGAANINKSKFEENTNDLFISESITTNKRQTLQLPESPKVNTSYSEDFRDEIYNKIKNMQSSQDFQIVEKEKSVVNLDAKHEMSLYDLKDINQDVNILTNIPSQRKIDTPLDINNIEGDALQHIWKNKTDPLESDIIFYTIDSHAQNLNTKNNVLEKERLDKPYPPVISIPEEDKNSDQKSVIIGEVEDKKSISNQSIAVDVQNVQSDISDIRSANSLTEKKINSKDNLPHIEIEELSDYVVEIDSTVVNVNDILNLRKDTTNTLVMMALNATNDPVDNTQTKSLIEKTAGLTETLPNMSIDDISLMSDSQIERTNFSKDNTGSSVIQRYQENNGYHSENYNMENYTNINKNTQQLGDIKDDKEPTHHMKDQNKADKHITFNEEVDANLENDNTRILSTIPDNTIDIYNQVLKTLDSRDEHKINIPEFESTVYSKTDQKYIYPDSEDLESKIDQTKIYSNPENDFDSTTYQTKIYPDSDKYLNSIADRRIEALQDNDNQNRSQTPRSNSNKISPFKISLGIQSYSNDDNEVVVKSFDPDKVPTRYRSDTVRVTSCDLEINDKIKIPIGSENDLCIEIKSNEQKDISDVVGLNLDTDITRNGFDNANETESDFVKRNVIIADEIRRTLVAVYEDELLPLRNTITELRNNMEMMSSEYIMLRGHNMYVKKPRPTRIVPLYKKCGCLRK